MLGIIRVLTTKESGILQEHGKKMEEFYGMKTVTHCIPDQSNGIYDNESEKKAIPKIVELARQMQEQYELDAITISCAADPGLDEVREIMDIPVLGAGVSGSHAAAMIGGKVGVIGITEEPPIRLQNELAERYFSHTYSPALRKTTDLFSEGSKEELLRVVNEAIQSGADIILFACTGFSTIRLKDYLLQHVSVPVVDLVEAQAIAYQLISKRASI